MHLNKGMEFRGGYYCHHPPPPQSAEERGGGGGGGVDGAARGSILPSPVPWYGVGVS